MLLVCGEEHLDAHMVIELIEFSPEDWPTQSQTPDGTCTRGMCMQSSDVFVVLVCTVARFWCKAFQVSRCRDISSTSLKEACVQEKTVRFDTSNHFGQSLSDLFFILARLQSVGWVICFARTQ